MRELVYDIEEVQDRIRKRFPKAKITDASDFIHTERFEVDVDDVSEDEFYVFAIREGFALSCLSFRVMLYGKERQDKIDKWISLAKKEVRT